MKRSRRSRQAKTKQSAGQSSIPRLTETSQAVKLIREKFLPAKFNGSEEAQDV